MDEFVIMSERLGASLWREEYAEDFVRLNGDMRVMRYFLKPLSRAGSMEFLERIIQEFDQYGYGLFPISRLADGKFIGFVGLHHFDFDTNFAPGVEIGWRLLPEYWGNGYASEMARACLGYARRSLRLREVYSFTSLANAASQRVMQKIGMRRVGEFDHPLVEADHPLRRHVLYRTDW